MPLNLNFIKLITSNFSFTMQPSMEVHAHAHLSHPAVPHGDGGLGLVGQNSRAPKDKVATGPSMDSGEKSKERENLIKSVAKHNGSDDDTAKSLLGVSCNDINSSGVKKKTHSFTNNCIS